MACLQYHNSRTRSEDSDRRCLHYYACVAAFASDEKLCEEFSSFVYQERSQEIVLSIQEQISGGIINEETLMDISYNFF